MRSGERMHAGIGEPRARYNGRSTASSAVRERNDGVYPDYRGHHAHGRRSLYQRPPRAGRHDRRDGCRRNDRDGHSPRLPGTWKPRTSPRPSASQPTQFVNESSPCCRRDEVPCRQRPLSRSCADPSGRRTRRRPSSGQKAAARSRRSRSPHRTPAGHAPGGIGRYTASGARPNGVSRCQWLSTSCVAVFTLHGGLHATGDRPARARARRSPPGGRRCRRGSAARAAPDRRRPGGGRRDDRRPGSAVPSDGPS